jgi:hypothetical protein
MARRLGRGAKPKAQGEADYLIVAASVGRAQAIRKKNAGVLASMPRRSPQTQTPLPPLPHASIEIEWLFDFQRSDRRRQHKRDEPDYFRGTDAGFGGTPGTLWKVRPQTTGGNVINERGLPVSQVALIKQLGGVIGLGEVPQILQGQQTQIGRNTTSSTPFVLPDPSTGPVPGGVCGSGRFLCAASVRRLLHSFL